MQTEYINKLLAIIKMKFYLTIYLIIFGACSFGQANDSVYKDLNEALKNPLLVKELIINSQKVDDFEVIGQFKNLEILEISECSILGFPNSISELVNLKVLRFNWNGFRGKNDNVSWKYEIKKICNLNKLEVLDLSYYNTIIKVPSNISCLKNLKELNLSTSIVFKLPNNIYKLKNLEILNIGQTGISILPERIIKLKKLKKIVLTDFKIEQNFVDKLKEQMPECEIYY